MEEVMIKEEPQELVVQDDLCLEAIKEEVVPKPEKDFASNYECSDPILEGSSNSKYGPEQNATKLSETIPEVSSSPESVSCHDPGDILNCSFMDNTDSDVPNDCSGESSSNFACQLEQSSDTLPKKMKHTEFRQWKKVARQSGQGYYTSKGVFVPAKSFVYAHCGCRYNCSKVSSTLRMDSFKEFWKLSSWEKQENYIISCVDVQAPRRATVKNSRKKVSRIFRLHGERVCKYVFIKTLGITDGRLNYALNVKGTSRVCSPDGRGKRSKNRVNNNKLESICRFLDRFPKYESLYSDSKVLYFSPDLCKTMLYKLYKNEYGEDSMSRCSFNNYLLECNVEFYEPKAIKCKVCDEFEQLLMDFNTNDHNRKDLERKWNEHHQRVEISHNFLKHSAIISLNDNTVLSFSFDMIKTALLPRLKTLNTSVVFFKRQLWLYSVSIHTLHDCKRNMMVWTEGDAQCGVTEVCSSIYHYFNQIDISKYKRVITVSDGCGGQNDNKAFIVFAMLMCNIFNLQSWEHQFIENGHSFLPNNSDFELIGKQTKYASLIYSIDQWIDIVRDSKGKPFKVYKMKGNFCDIEGIANSREFIKSNSSAPDKLNFLKLEYFKVKQGTDTVSYKEVGIDGEHQLECPLLPGCDAQVKPILLDRSHKIPKEKYMDLMSLEPLIPDVYKHFYRDIPHES